MINLINLNLLNPLVNYRLDGSIGRSLRFFYDTFFNTDPANYLTLKLRCTWAVVTPGSLWHKLAGPLVFPEVLWCGL